jgi:uncharacterized protein YihD (DUF1040 family)
VKLLDLLTYFANQMATEKEVVLAQGLDSPIDTTSTHRLKTAGTLHVYSFGLPPHASIYEDIPITILPPEDLEPTEGYTLQTQDHTIVTQILDSLGQATIGNTLIPDTSGFLDTAAQRLTDMAAKPESYALGPAERLVPWIDPEQPADHEQSRSTASPSVLTTIWHDSPTERWVRLGKLTVDLLRQNKRILLIAPNHQHLDHFTGFLAKTLQSAALPYKSLLSSYEVPAVTESSGMKLDEFGFEFQMHGFYAKSRANKDSLRKQYDRFRELTPILAYKGQKQRDLNEVKLLEWRLLAQLSEFQGKIKDIDKIVTDYDALPIWKRLTMQATGKNVQTLGEYRALYEQKIQGLMQEVEIAQSRIREIAPEAAIPKDMRPEYEELKDEITRLGGTQKIRELLAAGEATNRQAFIQNKRLVAATPKRVVTDPLFRRVRFDVLIAEDAPNIPAPLLLGSAGLIRERLILSGNTKDLSVTDEGGRSGIQWRQHIFSTLETPHPPSQ